MSSTGWKTGCSIVLLVFAVIVAFNFQWFYFDSKTLRKNEGGAMTSSFQTALHEVGK
jgi:hypothetical protein